MPTLTDVEHTILADIIEHCEGNDVDDLRPEYIADNGTYLGMVEDAMTLFAELGLGDALSSGDGINHFEVDLDAAKIARATWPVEANRDGFTVTAKTTTAITKQLRYTKTEAAQAIGQIAALVENGTITRRGGAAHKAHITRRTVEG